MFDLHVKQKQIGKELDQKEADFHPQLAQVLASKFSMRHILIMTWHLHVALNITVVPIYKTGLRIEYHTNTWPMISDRYFVYNRAAAAIASSTLKDQGIIKAKEITYVIDHSKLGGERTKYQKSNNKKI